MRKSLAYALLFALVISLIGCSKRPDENLTIRERIDSFETSYVNGTEVKDFVESYENAIYKSFFEIDGIEYGRIISSSESAEDAVNVCTRHFTDERYPETVNTVVECKVIYESDLFYGVYVKWSYYNFGEGAIEYDENVISFKRNVADITVRNVVYEEENAYKICTDQDDKIEQLALYLFYHEYDHWLQEILEYETQSSEEELTITICRYSKVGGDWGLPDEYYFNNQIVVVDKATGNIDFQDPTLLKKVEVWGGNGL